MKMKGINSNYLKAIAILICIGLALPGNTQIEVKPTSIEFNQSTGISYSYPTLSIASGANDLFNQGTIRFRAWGNHVFSSYAIGGSTLSINSSSKMYRSTSGTADLIPYAYGKVAPSTSQKVAGTDNFTFERSGSIVKIHFTQNVANELVIMVTPHCHLLGFTQYCEDEIITENGGTKIINVKLESIHTPFSFVAYKQ